MLLKEFLADQGVVLGYAEARRLAKSSKILVNGTVMPDADFGLKPGDVVTVDTKDRKTFTVR